MLILSRKKGERVVIDSDTFLCVEGIGREFVSYSVEHHGKKSYEVIHYDNIAGIWPNVGMRYLSSTTGSVRLGFIAPIHVTIHREEIQQRVDADLEAVAG